MTAAVSAPEPDPAVSESRIEGPYVGLRTYEETDARRYFGREDIVAELARMVKRAPLTVLFGVSGTGKSSMIRAGLFPIVRNELHLPVLIRLDFTGKRRDLRGQVHERIREELAEYNVDARPPERGISLRDYFARTPWWTPRNKLLTPFLVFDQFEEIFTVGHDHADQVAVLMDELAELVEHPARDIEAQVDIVTPRPRLMLALREDFLAHLEDFRVRMPSLASNRYRLTRMNGAQALRAVRAPADQIVDEDTAKKIVRFVAAGASSIDTLSGTEEEEETKHPLDTLEVEPAILSLVCEQLDIQRRKAGLEMISTDLLKTQGEKIVESFYDSAFEKLPRRVRVVVEDELVTNDGFRTTLAKADAYKFDGITPRSIQALLDKKILREENRFGSLHIELIHDRLAAIASDSRARRREDDRERAARERAVLREKEHARGLRRKVILVIGSVLGALLIAAIVFVLWVNAKRREVEKDQTRRQSRQLATFLLRAGRDALAQGDALTAIDRLQEASAAVASAGLREPAEYGLLRNRAVVALGGFVQEVDHGSEIAAVRVVGRDRLITLGRDGSMRSWRDREKQSDVPGDPSGVPIEGTYPSHSGKWVLVLRADASGEVRDVDKGTTRFSFQGMRGVTQTAQRPPTPAPAGLAPGPATAAAASERAQGVLKVVHPNARIAPDDSRIAVWSSQRPGVHVWDVEQGQAVESTWLRTVIARDVFCLAKGKLAVLTQRGEVVLVDPAGTVLKSLRARNDDPLGFVVSDDATVVAIAVEEGILLFDSQDPWTAGRLIPVPVLENVELSSDGRQLLVAGESQAQVFIGVWDTRDRTLQFALERSAARAHLVGNGSNAMLVVASHRTVEAWRVGSWEFLGTAKFDVELGDARIDIRSDGALVVAAAVKNAAVVRIVEQPWWSDRALLRASEELSPWSVLDGRREYMTQRSANNLRVDFNATHLILREPTREVARISHGGDVVDARVSVTTAGGRVAVLRGSGAVTLYDETLGNARLLDTLPVRAIRWTERQELITLGWSRTQVWSQTGTLLDTVPVASDDARVVYSPRRVVWTCVRSECVAWDARMQQRAARIQLEGAHGLELNTREPVGMVGIHPGNDAAFLPVVAGPENAAGESAPVRSLAWLDPDLLVSYEQGGRYVLDPKRRIANGPIVSSGDATIAVADSRLLLGSRDAQLAGTAAAVWQSKAPITSIRWQDNRLGVVDRSLHLSLLDTDLLGKSGNPVVAQTDVEDVQAAGSGAVLSPAGDRYGFVTPRNTIEIRMVADGSHDGAYELLPGQRVRRVLVAGASSSHVAALTDDGLVVWGAEGKPSDRLRGAYRDAVLAADGEHLVALRADNQAEVFAVAAGKLTFLKFIRAVAVSMDERGARIAAANGRGKIEIYQLADPSKPKNSHVVEKTFASSIVLSPPAGKYMWLPGERRLLRVFEKQDDVMPKLETASHCVFSGDGDFAACVFADKDGVHVQAIEIPSGKRVGERVRLSRLPETVLRCSSPDFHVALALVNGDNATIFAFDPKEGTYKLLADRYVTGCSLAGTLLWTLADNGVLQARSLDTRAVVVTRGGAKVLDTRATRDEQLHTVIAAQGHDLMVKTLSRRGASEQHLAGSSGIERALFLGDNEVAGVAGNTIKIWTFGHQHNSVRVLDASSPTPVSTLFVSREHKLVLIGHDDGVVALATYDATKPHVVFPASSSPVRHIALDEAARWLAASHDDGTVSIWQVEHDPLQGRREPLVRLEPPRRGSGAPTILFNRGNPSTALFTGSSNGEVRRWNLGGMIPEAQAVIKRARPLVPAAAPAP